MKFNQDNRSVQTSAAASASRTVFRLGQRLAVVLLVAGWSSVAFGQEPIVEKRSDGTTVVSPPNPVKIGDQVAPDPSRASKVSLTFGPETSIYDLILFFAPIKRINFVISDIKELQNQKVTIISNQEVAGSAAWEAFLSALEVSGYSLSIVGDTAKVVKSAEAGKKPIRIGKVGDPIRSSDDYVTHLIQLNNTRVDDMLKVIQTMAPSEAKIVAYPPTNTLIITDTASNIRKLYEVMNELDVAAPKSTLKIYQLVHADAAEVKTIIEELYGGEESKEPEPQSRVRRSSRARSRRSRTPAKESTEGVSAGSEAKYISKVLEDDRTNSLIVLANQDGHKAVAELMLKLDVDTDPTSGSQFHVYYLENAKAEDVASVLQELSEGGGSDNQSQNVAQRRQAQRNRNRTNPNAPEQNAEGKRGVIAAFDSGMRIAADENTNSLIIIASQDDYKVIRDVIDSLDVERRQVFVDAVVLELSSEDAASLGVAYHAPTSGNPDGTGTTSFVGAQLGASSLGLSQDALSGLAFGVFGEAIDVPITLPDGSASTLAVPAFGIALNAIKTFGSTNIISNPNLTTLDNEEAEITVGRKIPFPTSSGLNSLGSPVISFQREDVAITMKVTPRINSANFVTLELEVEVQEVEESAQSSAVTAAGGGFITSERRLQTVALVRDNQTMVIGGLVGSTESTSETKVPILGDLPLIGGLFRSRSRQDRKTNLMIFLTPHIIDEPEDMEEIQRVKEAQRQEFLRRFYGRSKDDFYKELQNLLRYSMNFVDQPTMYRGPLDMAQSVELSDDTRAAVQSAVLSAGEQEPGAAAGELPESDTLIIDDQATPPSGKE
ncbi:MAG: type II secretion system secretin GspD [Myxococcota bacterium]